MSEGFDLDAIPDSSQNPNEDVIYELGGSASVVPASSSSSSSNTDTVKSANNNNEDENDPISQSETLKNQGNEFFKKGDYLNAYDMYTDAIEACPGNLTGEDILKLQDEHEMKEREKANQRYLRDTDRRSTTRAKMGASGGVNEQDNADDEKDPKKAGTTDDSDSSLEPCEFVPPSHEFGTKLAVYYSNRAACLLHEHRYKDAIRDCDIALLLNPKYTKAYIRRMTAYEETEQSEQALNDAKQASTLDPNNREIQKHVRRLQKMEDERMEKLKEETMGKLKDLGNSILGNFGLSLDNFKAQQDPNTGSYNISFQN